MTIPAPPSYAGYHFSAEIISYAIWLYFRFPLSLRRIEPLMKCRNAIDGVNTGAAQGKEYNEFLWRVSVKSGGLDPCNTAVCACKLFR
jgi:transposase-like protein